MRFHLILLLLFSSLIASASEELIRTYRGVRSLGMGGLVTTTGVYDEAMFGNPATMIEAETWKLSILNVTAEVNDNLIKDINTVKGVSGSSGSSVITKLSSLSGRNQHARVTVFPALYMPHLFDRNTGLSFGVIANVQANLMLRSTLDLDSQTYVDAGPVVNFVRRVWHEQLAFGINLRATYRGASDSSIGATSFLSGTKLTPSDLLGVGAGIDGDIGVLYRFEKRIFGFLPAIGASLNNVAKSSYKFGNKPGLGKPPANDRTAAVGVRFDLPDLFFFRKIILAAEMQNIGSTSKQASIFKKTHMGLETKLLHFLSIRGGANQGYYTAGLGIDIPILKIDLATYGEELGAVAGQLEDRRYVARISFDI
ncbi:MAG: hypothetical protein AB7F43_11805 [Bacteriovoracia bacterium]